MRLVLTILYKGTATLSCCSTAGVLLSETCPTSQSAATVPLGSLLPFLLTKLVQIREEVLFPASAILSVSTTD